MPTPTKGYWIDGKRVPSVTTVLSRFKESGGLVHWAWSLGVDGKDYRDVRDQAATAGTCAHDMVEAFIRGRNFDPTPYAVDILAKAENSYSAFRRWADQCSLKPAKTEMSLLSKAHRFGGTLDAVTVDGELHLIDFKTSNSVYGDYLVQLAAYGLLYEENFGERVLSYDLLRFSKGDDADFAHFNFKSLSDEAEMFLCLRKAYELDQKIKRRV